MNTLPGAAPLKSNLVAARVQGGNLPRQATFAPAAGARIETKLPKGNGNGLSKRPSTEHSLADRLRSASDEVELLRSALRAVRALALPGATHIHKVCDDALARASSADRIVEEITLQCRVSRVGLMGKGQCAELVWPRHCCILLMSERLDWSHDKIAEFIRRERSNVTASIRSARTKIQCYPYCRRDYEAICARLDEGKKSR